MTIVLMLLALAGAAAWLAASPVRIVVAGLAVAAAHPSLVLAVLAVAAAVAVAAGLVITCRELAESRWLVIGFTHLTGAPSEGS